MKTVEDLIKDSLKELQKIGWENEPSESQESKLIFPKYCRYNEKENKKRVSEQEARFLFIRELEKIDDQDFHYSVETPTEYPYRFSSKGEKLKHPKKMDKFCAKQGDEEGGRSGEIDVCLHDKDLKRVCLVEFKAHLADVFEMEKDFLRLKYEPNNTKSPNYFVHIIENYDDNTIKKLGDKYKTVFDFVKDKGNIKIIVFVCFLQDKKYCKFEFEETNLKENKIYEILKTTNSL